MNHVYFVNRNQPHLAISVKVVVSKKFRPQVVPISDARNCKQTSNKQT